MSLKASVPASAHTRPTHCAPPTTVCTKLQEWAGCTHFRERPAGAAGRGCLVGALVFVPPGEVNGEAAGTHSASMDTRPLAWSSQLSAPRHR